MKSTPVLLAATLSAIFAAPVYAGGAADGMTVIAPLIRMVPPKQPATGVFFVLKNSDDKDHKLVKVESAAANVAEIHTHINEGGMMKMRPVKDVEIKAKSEIMFRPGGLHVMLIGLKQSLQEGENVTLKLIFEDDSSKEITAPVHKIQPMRSGADHMHMH